MNLERIRNNHANLIANIKIGSKKYKKTLILFNKNIERAYNNVTIKQI